MLNVDHEEGNKPPEDEAAVACCRVWHEVLLTVVADAKSKNKRRNRSAYSFLCSGQFEEVATLIGLDAVAVRQRLMPQKALVEYMQRRVALVRVSLPEPEPEPEKHMSACMKVKAKREAYLTAQQAATAASEPPGQAQPLTRIRIVDWYAMPFDLAEKAFPLLLNSIGLEAYETHCVSIGEPAL